jgi:acetyltransferase
MEERTTIMKTQLDSMMKPKTIAVVGASAKVGSIGYDLMYKLKDFGYTGTIYPINPKTDEILGIKAYKSLADIDGDIDLAVIAVPGKIVFNVVEDCHKKGIKDLVVISAGFKETGDEGAQLECKLKELIDKYEMRVVGPNCMGIINTEQDIMMNATFSPQPPIPGNAAFLSQSGALGIAIFYAAKDMNLGMSQFVSIGNKADLSDSDFIKYWENEKNTDLILLYLESVSEPPQFRKICEEVGKKKPIVVLKSGRSAAGAAAASSHTGSLAGADKAATALFSQCGILREDTMEEMFQVAQGFANSPLPQGKRIGILTNGGGAGIMCTDATISCGLEVAKLTDETKNKLREFLPSAASVRNPVDTIASVNAEDYERSLELMMKDPNVDAIIAIMIPLYLPASDAAKAMMKMQEKYNKPVLGVIMATNEEYKELHDIKDMKPVPYYKLPEHAAYALSRMYQYYEWKNLPKGKLKTFKDINQTAVDNIISAALADKRDLLTTLESMDILKHYGINTCKYAEAKDIDEAIIKAEEIGYPVAMKILSKTVSHKSDVGGVVVNIQSSNELRKAYENILAKARENKVEQHIDAVMLQEMIKGKREIVLGCATDPQYGPLMMFGLGGIFIEAIKDVVFKVHPLTDIDAKSMLTTIKTAKLLQGFRGLKGVDMDYMQDQLLRLSQLVSDFSIIDELDINPYIITDDEGTPMAVDGRIKFKVKSQEELDQLKSCVAAK